MDRRRNGPRGGAARRCWRAAAVSRGSVAALGFNYYDVGKQTGEIVVRILKGENPGDIPVKVAAGSDLVVNKGAAAKMGVTLPESVLKRATKTID